VEILRPDVWRFRDRCCKDETTQRAHHKSNAHPEGGDETKIVGCRLADWVSDYATDDEIDELFDLPTSTAKARYLASLALRKSVPAPPL
jgi:hypothetical protein